MLQGLTSICTDSGSALHCQHNNNWFPSPGMLLSKEIANSRAASVAEDLAQHPCRTSKQRAKDAYRNAPYPIVEKGKQIPFQGLRTERQSQLLLVKLMSLQCISSSFSQHTAQIPLQQPCPATSHPPRTLKCISLSTFLVLCWQLHVSCISMKMQVSIKSVRQPTCSPAQ